MRNDIDKLTARLAGFAPDTATATFAEREEFQTVIRAVEAIDTSEERNRVITAIAAVIADEHMDYLVNVKRLTYVEALEQVLLAAGTLYERFRGIDWEALALGLDAATALSAQLLGVWELSEN